LGFAPQIVLARFTKSGEEGTPGNGGTSFATTLFLRKTRTSSPRSTHDKTSAKLC